MPDREQKSKGFFDEVFGSLLFPAGKSDTAKPLPRLARGCGNPGFQKQKASSPWRVAPKQPASGFLASRYIRFNPSLRAGTLDFVSGSGRFYAIRFET